MALPQGFVLEQPAPSGATLPPGFELETPAAPALAPAPPATGIPSPRRPAPARNPLAAFGRSAASLADVTIGGLIPGAVQLAGYPVMRLKYGPEEASEATQAMVAQTSAPFGKAFGVTQTPEYQAEVSRQLVDFIGQNFQKGAAWIAEKTGLPQPDVESYMASASLALPKVASGTAQGARRVAASPLAQDVRAGLQTPFEPALQARRERLSAESYARGPQIDAAKDAQRLKLALNPVDIQPTTGPRLRSSLAGARGEEAIQSANRPRVNEIARQEMGLPNTATFNGPAAFNAARDAIAGPYNEIRKIEAVRADPDAIRALNSLRPAETLIGGEATAGKINALIDDALTKVDSGMSGAAFIDNISKLRKDAKRIHRNKNAAPDQIDLADTNLAIASTLESMLDNNIFNPKLREQYRDARQKMAKIYAYEAATDFNTGFVDPMKIARITSKDNALTGDIATLGRVAGNFPSAFRSAAESPWYTSRLSRSGFGGAAGAMAGGALAGIEGSIAGGVLGGLVGEFGSAMQARKIASPGYQAGLSPRDYRLPVNELISPSATSTQTVNALTPYVAPQTILTPGEGAFVIGAAPVNLRQASGGVYVAPTPAQTAPARGPAAQFVGPDVNQLRLPAPSARGTMGTLRAEDVRRATVSRELGREAEARQAAAEAAARKPAAREVILEVDPITGRIREASQGVKGATPETFRNFGADLASAANKVTEGRLFDMTATEKVAWNKTKVDLAEVVPGMKKLDDKAIAGKMMDRQWVEDAVTKAREKASAFEQLAARAKDAQARKNALAQRERMLDVLDTLEEQLRAPRPIELGGQGPKTRAAQRNQLAPKSSNTLSSD